MRMFRPASFMTLSQKGSRIRPDHERQSEERKESSRPRDRRDPLHVKSGPWLGKHVRAWKLWPQRSQSGTAATDRANGRIRCRGNGYEPERRRLLRRRRCVIKLRVAAQRLPWVLVEWKQEPRRGSAKSPRIGSSNQTPSRLRLTFGGTSSRFLRVVDRSSPG